MFLRALGDRAARSCGVVRCTRSCPARPIVITPARRTTRTVLRAVASTRVVTGPAWVPHTHGAQFGQNAFLTWLSSDLGGAAQAMSDGGMALARQGSLGALGSMTGLDPVCYFEGLRFAEDDMNTLQIQVRTST